MPTYKFFWDKQKKRYTASYWGLKRVECKHGPNIVYAGWYDV